MPSHIPNSSSSVRNKTLKALASPEQETLKLFFYGTLMDPAFLASLLSLSNMPNLRPAMISGFATKMWGPYPILVPQPDGEVRGVIWDTATKGHFEKLEHYEGDAYTWCECDAEVEEPRGNKQKKTKSAESIVVRRVRVFVSRDPKSKELEEGVFDLEKFKRWRY